MKTTPNHGLSYVEGNDKPADYPLISQENMTKLDTLIQQLIDGKAPLSHNHSIGQIMGLTEALDSKADQQATATALAGKASSSHTHTMDGITGLTAALAVKANQAAVDTALAQKANTSHTHTQGDITGLTAALAGKAAQATLDTRVPSALALRVDTTVGTRIFAGNTMIYGDTGWRNISGSLTNGWTGSLLIRRTGDTVVLRGNDLSPTDTTSINVTELPVGFISIHRHPIPTITHSQEVVYGRVNRAIVQIDRTTGSVPRDLTVTYPTSNSWPATLPGLPA